MSLFLYRFPFTYITVPGPFPFPVPVPVPIPVPIPDSGFRPFQTPVLIALSNKEKFLNTHLNSQSYCLRKVPGQTCQAGFRGTCFQASRSDSIHSSDLHHG